MRIIKIIFDRLTIKHIKQRTLIMYLAIQNILLALIVLVPTNVLLTNAVSYGELNYDHIKIFYTFCILVIFVIPYLMTPIFLSRSINTFYKTSVIDNLISSKVNPHEIVIAVFLRGFTFVVIMVSSAIPILSISFHFGGISISTIIKVFIVTLLYALLLASVCTYISSSIEDENIAMVISYVVCFIIFIATILIIYMFIWNTLYMALYSLVVILMTAMLLCLSINTAIFRI